MVDLEKIAQELNELESKIEKASKAELNELQTKVIKKRKHLIGVKNNLKKQNNSELIFARELSRKTKKLELQITQKKKSFEQDREQKPPKVIKKSFVREEEIKLKEMIEMDLDSIEKARIVEKIIGENTKYIESLRRKIKKIQKSKKEYHDDVVRKVRHLKKKNIEIDEKLFSSWHEFDFQIKELEQEIIFQRKILASYKSLLAHLHNKDKKAVYYHKKEEKVKIKKENNAYFLIVYSLLDDDKNYLFLKEIIEENANFINARYNHHPLLFEILDKYIENVKLELVNQKIKHINPNYFYSLLKLFKSPLLKLSMEEEKHFEDRIEELKKYLENNGYTNSHVSITQLEALLDKKEPKEKEPIIIDRYNEQKFLNSAAKMVGTRVNLTREHLQKINTLVSKFQDFCVTQTGIYPNEKEISEFLNLPLHDIRNSQVILDTVGFENTKYAISFGFSKTYETYIRIHVLDTSVLYEESPSLKTIKKGVNQTFKEVKKALKFRTGNSYPVLTYQYKVANGKVDGFKIYESVITIDRLLSYEDINNYRNDDFVKSVVGNLIVLRNNYNLENSPINITSIEPILDTIINIELKEFVIKKQLPILYFTELEMQEEEKVQLHYQICHYLSKISKKEANDIFQILKKLRVNRYYGFEPLEESKIEIDTKNGIGYFNSLLIKCGIHGLVSGTKIEIYQEMLEKALKDMNQDDLYMDYFKERKLIRSKQAACITEKQ